jgi:hypothetical protein
MSSMMTFVRSNARVKTQRSLIEGEIGHPFDPLMRFVEMRQRDGA